MRVLALALVALGSVAVVRGQDTTAAAFESSSVAGHTASGLRIPPGSPSDSCALRDRTLLQQMQEQLGLKLTPARETADVLVIDSATMPKVD
jgi:uncharacterized protein (TIGR03435 family)